VEDRRDAAEIVAVEDPAFEVVGVDVVREAQRNEVFPFFRRVESIDDENVVDPSTVQSPNDGASDQAGAAGHDDRTAVQRVLLQLGGIRHARGNVIPGGRALRTAR